MEQGTAQTREATAYHEAGHAVAIIWFDIQDVESATIDSTDDFNGRVLIDQHLEEICYEELSVRQVPFECAVMAALAGVVAQKRYQPEIELDWDGTPDHLTACALMEWLDAPTDEVRDAYLKLLKLRTEALIEQEWARVERVAALLLAQGSATGDEVRAAFRDPNVAMLIGSEDSLLDSGVVIEGGEQQHV